MKKKANLTLAEIEKLNKEGEETLNTANEEAF